MGSGPPGHRLAESFPWNRFLGSIKVSKIPPLFILLRFFFRFNLAYFWNKPSSLRFDLFKFLNNQTLIRFDLSVVWNKQSSLRFDLSYIWNKQRSLRFDLYSSLSDLLTLPFKYKSGGFRLHMKPSMKEQAPYRPGLDGKRAVQYSLLYVQSLDYPCLDST